MIHVIATIELQPGSRIDFITILKSNVPLVLAEDGCIAYSPTVDQATDLPAQAPLRENTVVIIEAWDSLEHLLAHLKAPHMMRYRERVKDMVVSTSLQVLTAP